MKTTRLSTTTSISPTNVEWYVWDVGECIKNALRRTGEILKYARDDDGRDFYLAPLSWYVTTGRASCDFLRLLVNAKPFMVARILMKGGSYEEALERLKGYLGLEVEI